MNIPHPKFCVLPWVSLEASPIGTVRPCCLADHEITDPHGQKYLLGETAFSDIRQSQHMQNLRQQFLLGQQPETCRRCWAEEDSGRTSKRQHTLERLHRIIPDDDWTEEPRELMFLDLKLGNICNLKCRICGSWSSSTYASEEIKFQKDKKNNFHYAMMKLGRWPRETPAFWKDLENNMHSLRYLEFTGGEPFMIQEHFELLDKLVSTGHARHIELHYNTNGTVWPSGAEKIWKAFRIVEIAFSIDDIGDRFEYQRAGADWLSVNSNIELFKEMRNRNRNMRLQVCSTVNVFNVLYLDQLAQWIDNQNFDFVYWNMLHDAPYYSIASLPDRAKHQIAHRLQTADFSQMHQQEIDRIIAFMLNGTSTDGSEMLARIIEVDQRRSQSLANVAPELAALINYEN